MSLPSSASSHAKSIHVVAYATHLNPKRSELVAALLEESQIKEVWSTHLMTRPKTRAELKADLYTILAAAGTIKPDLFVVVDNMIAEELAKLTTIPIKIVNLDLPEKIIQICLALDRLKYDWRANVFILYNTSSKAEAVAWINELKNYSPKLRPVDSTSDLRGAISDAVSSNSTLIINLLDHVIDRQFNSYLYSEYIKKELGRVRIPTLGNILDKSNNESFIVQRASHDLLDEIESTDDKHIPIYSVYMNLDSLRRLNMQNSYLDIWDSIHVLEK